MNEAGQFYWSLIARNGKTLADSGESYRRRIDCTRAIASVKRSVPTAKVVDETE